MGLHLIHLRVRNELTFVPSARLYIAERIATSKLRLTTGVEGVMRPRAQNTFVIYGCICNVRYALKSKIESVLVIFAFLSKTLTVKIKKSEL